MNAIEAAAEDVDAPPAFVQQLSARRGMLRATVRRHPDPTTSSREFIAKLLTSQGKQLKSTLLTSLASKIAADPFAKVKQLIQELIERLLQEASNEANQKGWCDKALSAATQKRTYASEEIADLNSQMNKLEAVRGRLGDEISTLNDDIQELKDNRQKAVNERSEEAQQNNATVSEAQQGLDALNMCIELLDKFYKTMKKNEVNLTLVQAPADDAPDTGFTIGEAYTGAQGEAGGILGMLDVMKSDFTRTVTETQTAEAQAQQDHLEFMTQTGETLEQKKEAHGQKDEQLTNANTAYSEADDKLVAESDILQGSIQELIELKAACIDTGMSYADRVSRREDEIEALKKALCILGRYAQYGPDGAADGC